MAVEDSPSEPEKGRTGSQPSPHAARPPPSPAARPPCAAGVARPACPPRFAILTTLNLRKITFQAPSGRASNYYRFAAIKKKKKNQHRRHHRTHSSPLHVFYSCRFLTAAARTSLAKSPQQSGVAGTILKRAREGFLCPRALTAVLRISALKSCTPKDF